HIYRAAIRDRPAHRHLRRDSAADSNIRTYRHTRDQPIADPGVTPYAYALAGNQHVVGIAFARNGGDHLERGGVYHREVFAACVGDHDVAAIGRDRDTMRIARDDHVRPHRGTRRVAADVYDADGMRAAV